MGAEGLDSSLQSATYAALTDFSSVPTNLQMRRSESARSLGNRVGTKRNDSALNLGGKRTRKVLARLPARKGKQMTRNFMILSLGFGAMILATNHAFAQGAQNCGARQPIIERLADRFGESRQSIGIGTKNRVVETFANPDTGSWTITVTMPNGMTCLIASGHAYETLDEVLTPAGSPT